VGTPFHYGGLRSDRDDARELDGNGPFCHGDTPTIADAFLVPQVYNAQRAGIDLAPFPTIRRIYEDCNKDEAFQKAQPERQPDAA
jgi:glutathione S-transferase